MKLNPRSFLFFSFLCQSLLYLGQAVSCEAGYYAENNLTCVACEDGKSSPEGALSIDQCQPCADNGCKICKGITKNACQVCDLDYSLQNSECISSNNGSPGTSYTCVDKGCIECFGNNPGQCSTCDAGYYLENNQCVSCGQGKSSLQNSTKIDACTSCDNYPDCQICIGLGQGQCISCQNGFSLINGACESSEIKCEDSNCIHCSGPGTGKCLECNGKSYLINGTCRDCPSGSNCQSCDDKNCELCGGEGTGQCLSCEANYYLSDNTCASCNNGKFSLAGSLNYTDCFSCEDLNCAFCSESGLRRCSTCENGYYLTANKTCNTCEDENCATCVGANIGRCTSCLNGFELISGTCKLPGESIKTNNVVSASIRYDMTMTQFTKEGGKNYFIAKLSQILSVGIEQVTVKSVRKGSVIIDFEVGTSGDESVAKDMKKTMDEAVPAGQMDFYSGSKVLNYNSQIGERDNESDEKKSKKVGIIVGTVIGVACIVVALLIWKKVAMVKAKRALSVGKNHQRIAPFEDSVEKTFKTEI